jgi:pyruvate,water dikinase
MYCLPLDREMRLEDAGEKACNLSIMIRHGFPVPPGFVVTAGAFADFHRAGNEDCPALRGEIAGHLQRLCGEKFMVRSSAVGEDSSEASFAGQLDSFVTGGTVDAIMENIRRCWNSYNNQNVRVYQQQKGVTLRGMGVIVQEMIEPDYAGVLFTRSLDGENRMLCEYVEGHGEQLVSGATNPGRFHCHRDSLLADEEAPFDFSELFDLALRLESLFDKPLDIEWAITGGRTFIVQSRPITVPNRSVGVNEATPEDERRIYWSNTNVNENYPGPITPLLYSIARESYYHYFKNLSRLLQLSSEAIGELEADYANVIGAFGCRMYYNMTSIHNIIGESPFAGLLRRSFDNFVGYQEGERKSRQTSRSIQRVRFLASFSRLNYALKRNVRTFEACADEFARKCSDASDSAALRECFHRFIEIRMHNWYRASLADFFAMAYHGLLGIFCRRCFGEESQGIHNRVIQAIPDLVSSRPVAETWKIAEMIRRDAGALELLHTSTAAGFLEGIREEQRFAPIREAIDEYLRLWGFRCSGELMLTEKSFCDAPEKFIDLLRGYIDQPGEDPGKIIGEKAAERRELMRGLRRRLLRRRGLLAPIALAEIAGLQLLVRLCFNGIASRERVRLKQASLYHSFKTLLRGIGEEFVRRGLLDDAGDIFYLRYQEIAENLTSSDMLSGTLKELVTLRRGEFEESSKLLYPDDFFSVAGEYPLPEHYNRTGKPHDRSPGDAIRGLSACGGSVRGKVRVLESVMELGRIRKGDILVTRQTDPGWATIFPLISGLIVERGGMLSHGAIVAREFGIPAIIGVPDATAVFIDDEEIELNGDRGEIYRIAPTTPLEMESI